MKNILSTLLINCLLLSLVSANAQVPQFNSYPSARSTLFLDFDGHLVNGTSWNYNGPISCSPSNLTASQIEQIFYRVAEDYRPFNVNVTTDSLIYWAAPANSRMRIVLTVTSSWYGSAGGVAYIGSFTWGDNTPAFVFTALLNYNTKYIAEAASHELGHTLGLRHQSAYDGNCIKTAEYNAGTGSGEIAWAPIMGVGYYRNMTLWNNGANPYGCTNYQDDLGIITSASNGFGYRPDDHGNIADSATTVPVINNEFMISGLIEKITDADQFSFSVYAPSDFRLDAVPFNIGTGTLGSNLDIEVDLFNSTGTLLGTYNPELALSSSIDTVLFPGSYYLKIRGKGNIYAPEYASLGSYNLRGVFDPVTPLPLHKLELQGINHHLQHQLDWIIEADENVVQQVLEVSSNGIQYSPLATIPNTDRNYRYLPTGSAGLNYRLFVKFDNGRQNYSNVVTLRSYAGNKPAVISNPVQNSLNVKSPVAFNYIIFDYSGRAIIRGKIAQGFQPVDISTLSGGMYLIRFENGAEVYSEKFMKL